MRLFLMSWPDFYPEYLDVVDQLRQARHEIVYWVGSFLPDRPAARRFPGIIFHDHEDALWGRGPTGLRSEDFPPPSPELLAQLATTESEALLMMSKRFDWMGVYERQRLYYTMVRYWHGVLMRHQPERMIFPSSPHSVYDFVAYRLAKLLHIPTIILEPTWVGDRLYVMTDYEEGCRAIAGALSKNQERTVTAEDLEADLREYYLRQTNPRIDNTPPSVNNFIHKYSWKKLYDVRLKFIVESIRNGSFFQLALRNIGKRFEPTIRDEFASVQTPADLSQPFIYVPLHYQPEGTTSPLGGIYVDQILMVEALAAALPGGWQLYVKENPQQWQPRGLNYFSLRYKGYYRALAAIPRVRLVPLSTNTFDLIQASRAVATVTGTAGWEALLRNKPALIFGYPWYRHCPGVKLVRDTGAVRAALADIQAGFAPTPPDIRRYLASLQEATFHGYLEEYGKKISSITPVENGANLAQALLAALAGK